MPKKFKIQLIDEPVSYKKKCAYEKFLIDVLPVRSGTFHGTLPVECIPDSIKEKLEIERFVWRIHFFKTEEGLFYSSYQYQTGYDREKICRDDGYTSGDIYVYKPTIKGAVVSEKGDMIIYPDKDYYFVGSHRDTEFDGMCGIYNPTYNYYAKDIRIEFGGSKMSTTTPAKTLQEFASQNMGYGCPPALRKILGAFAEKETEVKQPDQDLPVYMYHPKPTESVCIASLPVQEFNNGLTLFSTYVMSQTRGADKRSIHLFIPEANTHIVLAKTEQNGQSAASLAINGNELSTFPDFTGLSDARQKALAIPSAGRFSEVLETYVFSDPQKRLLKIFNLLDSYVIRENALVPKCVKITRKKSPQKPASTGRIREE